MAIRTHNFFETYNGNGLLIMDDIVFIISHNSLSHSNNKEETSLRTFTLQLINIIHVKILRDCLPLIVFVLQDNSQTNTYFSNIKI